MSIKRQCEMKSIAMSMLPLARKLIGKRGMLLADLLLVWEKIVGDQLSAFTCPERLDYLSKDNSLAVLRLKVLNGAVALEVQHNKNTLLEKINAYFGSKIVADIKIVQDGTLNFKGVLKNNQPPLQKNLVSKNEQNYIDDLSEGIVNPKLREKLAELGKAVLTCNK